MQQLGAVHIQLDMVRRDPDRVDGANNHPRKGKEGAKRTRPVMALCLPRGLCVAVRHKRDTRTGRDQTQDRLAGDGLCEEEPVNQGDDGSQQDAHGLVEGHGAERQRGVEEDDRGAHGRREREDGELGGGFAVELLERGEQGQVARQQREQAKGQEEVVAGEDELRVPERRLDEDCLVDKHL